jgi:glutamate synthase (NADPH/NADH) large chain/glutamate synthase (ferredoxin)
VLRAKFAGQPEHVVNYLFMVAEEARAIMARLGVPTVDELIGRTDLLAQDDEVEHWKAQDIDLSAVLVQPSRSAEEAPRHFVQPPDPVNHDSIDLDLVEQCRPAIEGGERVELDIPIANKNRAVGGLLSSEIARQHGTEGLPAGSIEVKLRGSAGQSFGAWLAPGVCLSLEGDANDYIGKGLSGGTLIVRPHRGATYSAEDNVVIGNVALYGATQGRAFFRGLAGERFAVRNSGAVTVVEGIGDHGCEYMTGGRVVVLGPTGINFAAGMSGGIAYVLDEDGGFRARCNPEMVRFAEISEAESNELLALIEEHRDRTGSPVAAGLVGDWDDAVSRFVKVLPYDYERALAEQARQEATAVPAVGA